MLAKTSTSNMARSDEIQNMKSKDCVEIKTPFFFHLALYLLFFIPPISMQELKCLYKDEWHCRDKSWRAVCIVREKEGERGMIFIKFSVVACLRVCMCVCWVVLVLNTQYNHNIYAMRDTGPCWRSSPRASGAFSLMTAVLLLRLGLASEIISCSFRPVKSPFHHSRLWRNQK